MDQEEIRLDWTQLAQLQGRQFATGKQYNVHIKRESLPLVFVPGIMGSRLHVGNDLVWDPNNTYGIKDGLTRRFFFASPADRKTWLIDTPGRQVVEYAPGKPWEQEFENQVGTEITGLHGFDWLPMGTGNSRGYGNMMEWSGSTPPILSRQGWCQVAWPFYGSFLVELAQQQFGDYTRYFMFPVYAVGYDWVDDNGKAGDRLVKRIAEIVQAENAKPDRYCEKVILISHSMGGLVARAAAKQDSSQILGIIHGAQPVTGAPAAYRRMRGGFESDGFISGVQADVMGPASKDVMPVLANCPGGLELLPTQAYIDDRGGAQWLMRFGPDGSSQPIERQPQENPYSGIYSINPDTPGAQEFLRLIYNSDLLNPPVKKDGKGSRPRLNIGNKDAFRDFTKNLKIASTFHSGLDLFCHDNTYHMYVKGGNAAFQQIRFRYAHPGDFTDTIALPNPYGLSQSIQVPPDQGFGTDLDPAFNGGKGAYFKIDSPDSDMGDGTVPRSSGSALKDSPHIKGTFTVDGLEHSAFYQNNMVRAATYHFVECLADIQKGVRMGQIQAAPKQK